MNDFKEYIINLEGFLEQEIITKCPAIIEGIEVCKTEMTWDNVIGFGEYPKGGYRSSLKPFSYLGMGWECPICGAKSVCHANKDLYESVIIYKNLRKTNYE